MARIVPLNYSQARRQKGDARGRFPREVIRRGGEGGRRAGSVRREEHVARRDLRGRARQPGRRRRPRVLPPVRGDDVGAILMTVEEARRYSRRAPGDRLQGTGRSTCALQVPRGGLPDAEAWCHGPRRRRAAGGRAPGPSAVTIRTEESRLIDGTSSR